MASIKRSNTLGYKLDIGDVIWGYDSYESIESVEPLVSGVQLSSHINQIASSLTGDWLKNPQQAITNGNWIGPGVVPLEYTQGSEELAIYLFDGGSGGGAITGSFGIDNHLAVWVNGEYRFGAYSPIHFYENDLPFKEVDLGTLQPGINAIQILRSDQYGWAGADWEIDYDSDASIKGDDLSTPTETALISNPAQALQKLYDTKQLELYGGASASPQQAGWNFGYKQGDAFAFIPYGASTWRNPDIRGVDESGYASFIGPSLYEPTISLNVGTTKDAALNLWWLPSENRYLNDKTLLLHPGPYGEAATVRYVADLVGQYRIAAEFRDLDPYGGDGAKGEIWLTRANGEKVRLFEQAWENGGPEASYSPSDLISLNIGDVVEFDVLPNGGYDYDSTSLMASIELEEAGSGDHEQSVKEENDPGDKIKEEDATPVAKPTLKELSSSYIGTDHLGKPFYKLQGDLWWGKKDARIISSKEGDDAFSVKFYLGSKGKKYSGNLDNGKPTIVYAPGWQDSPSSPNSQNWWKKMYDKVGNSVNLAIVDWSGMAEKTGKMVMPIFEATVTRQVGEVVADALIKAGAKPSDLTLVGHSLGSFVMGSAAMEIKRLTKKKVNELVALDTAFGLSDIPNWFGNLFTGKQWSDYDTDVRPEANGMSPGEDHPYDFTSKLAKKTSSYTVSDLSGLIGSSAGNNTRGATAMHPYIVQYTPTVEWTGNLLADPSIATAYHNGTIGIYADLFAKDNLHPDSTYQLSTKKSFNARGEVVKAEKGDFKGVIVAPQPWSSDVEKRKAPNSIGWLDPDSDRHYPDIYGSAHDDFMFFDGFNNWVLGLYDTNKGVRLFAGDGNDSLASMQQDGKGVDTLIGGKGADVFHIGFGRYGQKIQPYKDKWDIDLFGKGTGSYVVIEDFKPNQKDKIIFGWNQKDVGYKSISEFGIAGAGTAFHVGGDLVAYVPTLDPGDKKTENWINNPRYIEFVGKKYMTDFDSHLLNG